MSVARLERSPIISRWARLRRWSGRSSGPRASTQRHTDEDDQAQRDRGAQQQVGHDEEERERAGARARTSMAFPMWARSLLPIATTSPVATRWGRVAPRRMACRVTSWTTRYAAVSQLLTANRCRMIPLIACTTRWRACSGPGEELASCPWRSPPGRSRPHHRRHHRLAQRPDDAEDHAHPSVRHCPFASHHRNRAGDRWSAVPGWSRGRRRTAQARLPDVSDASRFRRLVTLPGPATGWPRTGHERGVG